LKLFLIIIFLLIIPIGLAVEECSRINQDPSEVPCLIRSSYMPDTGCNQPISIYLTNNTGNSTFVLNAQWQKNIPYCQFIWNITTPVGTYVYNSSVESGMITLKMVDNVLSLVFMFIFLIAFFVIIGALQKEDGIVKVSGYGLGMIQFLMFLWVMYMKETNQSITQLLWINAITFVSIIGMLGVYGIFIIVRKMFTMKEDETEPEDTWTKWQNKP